MIFNKIVSFHLKDSPDERTAFERAYAFGMKAPYHEKLEVIKDEGDITIDIAVVGKAINGEPITISVKVNCLFLFISKNNLI